MRVQGSGFRVQGSGFRVQGLGFRVYGYVNHPPPPHLKLSTGHDAGAIGAMFELSSRHRIRERNQP